MQEVDSDATENPFFADAYLIPSLATCADCSKLPVCDLKDIFLMSKETSI